MKILLLAAEAAPLVQVSEVGEAVGGLARALAGLGHEVRVVMPFSGAIDRTRWSPAVVARVTVPHVGGHQTARVYEVRAGGVIFNLIAAPPIPRAKRVYGADVHEAGPKFIFTGLAALGLCRALGWQPAIVHGYGSPSGPALYWLDTDGQHDMLFQQTATVFSTHPLEQLNASAARYLLEYGLTPSDAPRLPDAARATLAGLAWGHAQVIARSTAWPAHAPLPFADEAKTWMAEVLEARRERVTDVPPALDLDTWNPRKDRQLAARYDADSLNHRAANKRALQQALGLPVQPEAPLIGVVPSAGGDPALPALSELLTGEPLAQVVILGEALSELRAAFPERVRRAGKALPASLFYAGVDLLLDPAHGQPTLIALRYGAVPVTTAAGPVIDYALTRRGTGFRFTDYNASGMLAALRRALRVYQQPGRWRAVQRRGMRQAQQLSWAHAAAAYLALYQQASIYRKEAVTRLSARLADDPAEASSGSLGGPVAEPGLATLR